MPQNDSFEIYEGQNLAASADSSEGDKLTPHPKPGRIYYEFCLPDADGHTDRQRDKVGLERGDLSK